MQGFERGRGGMDGHTDEWDGGDWPRQSTAGGDWAREGSTTEVASLAVGGLDG